ncbi:MAG: S41 family peptidase [Turneriella sp.]
MNSLLRNEKIVVVEVIEKRAGGARRPAKRRYYRDHLAEKRTITETGRRIEVLRGKPGTEITISVRRSNAEQPLFFSMIREVVKAPSVKKMPGDKQVMHLLVRQLNYQALTEMREYLTADSRPLLLDLRSCPGGLLESSHQFAEIFLPTGRKNPQRSRAKKESNAASRHRRKLPISNAALLCSLTQRPRVVAK